MKSCAVDGFTSIGIRVVPASSFSSARARARGFPEISAPLRQAQRERLGRGKAHWHDTVETALEASGGQALVFSNELVDAFPCHVLTRRDGKWREVGLRNAGDRVVDGSVRGQLGALQAHLQ